MVKMVECKEMRLQGSTVYAQLEFSMAYDIGSMSVYCMAVTSIYAGAQLELRSSHSHSLDLVTAHYRLLH